MIAKPGPHKEKIVSDQDANYRQIWANADCTEKIQGLSKIFPSLSYAYKISEYYVPGVSAVENKLGGVRLFGSVTNEDPANDVFFSFF